MLIPKCQASRTRLRSYRTLWSVPHKSYDYTQYNKVYFRAIAFAKYLSQTLVTFFCPILLLFLYSVFIFVCVFSKTLDAVKGALRVIEGRRWVNIVPSFLKGSRVRGPVVFCANLISWSGFQLERNSTTRQCVCFFESDIETLSSVESTVADYH